MGSWLHVILYKTFLAVAYWVCAATMVSHLTYAAPSWHGSITTEGLQRLQAILNKAHRWVLSGSTHFYLHNLLDAADKRLFKSVLHSPVHVVHRLLPPPVAHKYVLRRRVHNRAVPMRGIYTKFNFIAHTLLPDYGWKSSLMLFVHYSVSPYI